MLDKNVLKDMRDNAEWTLSGERPADEVTVNEAALAADVLDLIKELDRVRKLHSEEQGRSADRLRIAVKALEEVADGPDRHYPGVWIKRVKLALYDIKKVGIKSEVS